MNFSHELVLVTGSSRGIGKAIAFAFAEKGATVILNGATNEARLKETYESFLNKGFKVYAYFGDLSDYNVASSMMDTIKSHYGKLPSIVINNAGISHVGLFTDTTPEMWNKILTTNLNSAYHCSYLTISSMLQREGGIIINISSIWGMVGASCEVAYSTSKAALNGFTKALAKELGPSHIRVNGIACGWIDTDMTSCYTEEEKSAFVDEIPLCKTGSPQDVANTCLYLASPLASYVTGQIITLDGGLL